MSFTLGLFIHIGDNEMKSLEGLTLKDLELLLAAVRENKAIDYAHAYRNISKSCSFNTMVDSNFAVNDWYGWNDTCDGIPELFTCAQAHAAYERTKPNSAFNLVRDTCRKHYQNIPIKSDTCEWFSETTSDDTYVDYIKIAYHDHKIEASSYEVFRNMDSHITYANLIKSITDYVSIVNYDKYNELRHKKQFVRAFKCGSTTIDTRTYSVVDGREFMHAVCEYRIAESNANTGDRIEISQEVVMHSSAVEFNTSCCITTR